MPQAVNTRSYLFSDKNRRVKWGKGVQAGLITGLLLFFANRGLPWTSSGVILPNIMGRNVLPGDTDGNSMWLGIAALHMAVAALYGCIIAPAVYRLRPITAGVAGGLIGVVLYFINLAVFNLLVPDARNQSELSPIIMHVAFGIICAECYKGISRREVAPELKHSGPQEA